MIKQIFQFIISFSLMIFLFNGCATILKGYEDRVDLINASDDIKVYSNEGIEIPISNRIVRQYSQESKKYEDKEIKTINLRSDKEHMLLLKSGDKEKLIQVYPRIGGGWLIIDFISLIFPVFIDAYTGNWNHFQPIIVTF